MCSVRTSSADHVFPLHYIGVTLVELANALAWQAAVVELQDVPDLHCQSADLVAAPLLCLHQAVAPAHIEAIQNGADGCLMEGQHQWGIARTGLITGGLLLVRIEAEERTKCAESAEACYSHKNKEWGRR